MTLPHSRPSVPFIPALCLLVFTISDVVTGQSPQKQEPREQSPSTEVRCLIRVDSSSWKQSGPALVHLTVENLTDRNLNLATMPTLYLNTVRGPDWSYWAPVDIVHDKPLDVSRRPFAKGSAVSIKPVPLKIHLVKGR